MRILVRILAALLVVAVPGWASCGGRAPAEASGAGSASGPAGADADEEITVFAAASLTEAFRDVAGAFQTEADRSVVLNLAGSQTLAAQILAGAPADVFVSADAVQMERVRSAGLLASEPVAVAENGLAIVTEPGNPRGVEGLADLARPELSVVLAAPEVPVGRYAGEALEEAGIRPKPVSLEMDAKQVVAKVVLGEADAGIVYRTDVVAAGEAAAGIDLGPRADQRAVYRMGILAEASDAEGARRFVEYLRSPPGRRILRSHGFEVGGFAEHEERGRFRGRAASPDR